MGRKKSRDKKKRKNKLSKLEKKFSFDVNDECPNLFKCYDAAWEFKCCGNYYNCRRYKTGDLNLPSKTYEQWEMDNFKNYVPVR